MVNIKISFMKVTYVLLACLLILVACEKDTKVNDSLIGKWVDKQRREDTLVVYRAGNKDIIFDNSLYYRSTMRILIYPPGNQFLFRLNKDQNKIGVKWINNTDEDAYVYYDFEWIVFMKEFRISQNAIRPYLSSIGNLDFERVD